MDFICVLCNITFEIAVRFNYLQAEIVLIQLPLFVVL